MNEKLLKSTCLRKLLQITRYVERCGYKVREIRMCWNRLKEYEILILLSSMEDDVYTGT